MAKFKHCCRGRVPWEHLTANDPSAAIRHLTTRGKNIAFLNAVFAALQLDTDKGAISHPQFKRAFTAKAVRSIHEAVAAIWPDPLDLERVLREEAAQTSGLYIGMYTPERLTRGLTRHSLYADRILLVDPLRHPHKVKDEFNPILHPEEHRTMTLRWITLWVSLGSWIDDGIVGFIRSPGDLNPQLANSTYRLTRQRYDRHPELQALVDSAAKEERNTREYDDFIEDIALRHSDAFLRRQALEEDPSLTESGLDAFIVDIRRRRDEHPYYLEPEENATSGQDLMSLSTGTNYEQAKHIATLSNSYLMTDLAARWREIEMDRADSHIDEAAWSPFARAFHGLPFRFLDDVPLEAALALRRENRLSGLRSFLKRTWDATDKTQPFDAAAVTGFAAELEGRVSEAEAEWRSIDTGLLKMIGKFASAAALSAPSLIATGQAQWIGAAAVVAGGAALAQAHSRRKAFRLTHPAGFFIDLRDRKFGSGGDR